MKIQNVLKSKDIDCCGIRDFQAMGRLLFIAHVLKKADPPGADVQ